MSIVASRFCFFFLKNNIRNWGVGRERGRLEAYCVHQIVNFIMWPSWVAISVSFLVFLTCIFSITQKEHVSLR